MSAATAIAPPGGVSTAAWDRLAGPRLYSTARWLEFCAMHGGTEPGAAVAYAAGEPAAAVPYSALTASPTALYRWNDALAERGLPALRDGGLLVGPTQGYRAQLLGRGGTDALVAELRERAGDGACVAMYATTEAALALREAGVAAPPVLLEADASLALPDGGWDGWLATLPSKRRISVRREVRAFREAGCSVVRLGLTECLEQLPPLAAATQAKYGSAAPASFWESLFRLHAAGMGERAQVALCLRDGGVPLGFCLYYVHGETLYLRWAGFDYGRLAGAAEYFNVTLYSQVMAAAGLGVRRIHIGIKSVEAKALRGAELRPLWLVDLASDSPLTRARGPVLRHNRAAYERLAADGRTRGALREEAAWRELS